MDLIANIKKFLRTKGLNWNGQIIKGKEKEVRFAGERDFENCDITDMLLSFGSDGYMAITAEIDLTNFKIHGECFDYGFSCYAGDNDKNIKLCQEQDLTKEWIEFQIKNSGLLFASALRVKCEKDKAKVKETTETRVNQLNRKIEYLQRSIDKIKSNETEKLKEIQELEKLAESI
jgi:hypothetical protein